MGNGQMGFSCPYLFMVLRCGRWAPDPSSRVAGLVRDAMRTVTGHEPAVQAIHAGAMLFLSLF